MPELPEVEITKENLERWLGNRVIARARVMDRRVLRGQSVRRVERVLSGARLRGIHRRGKYLIWDLGDRGGAVAHLGMSGKFVVRARREPDPPATCVVLEVGSGRRVVFSDYRRFGRFQIEDRPARETLARLGIDALDRGFTISRLSELLDTARLPIKTFLMDQHRIAGLGNIQVAEALFHAGIHPVRMAGQLSDEERSRLHRSIRTTLKQAVRRERSNEMKYLHEADSENHFLIYGHAGEPCSRCGTSVKRIVQAGRSTYYCARCQPRRSASRASTGSASKRRKR